jgi:hypothetical protein
MQNNLVLGPDDAGTYVISGDSLSNDDIDTDCSD